MSKAKPTVLVVDDEEMVRSVVARALEGDFTVLRAGSVDTALVVLGGHPEISAIVSDVMMPGKTGVCLHSEATARGFNGAWVFMSGGADANALAYIKALRPRPTILAKPFTIEQVRSAALAALANAYQRLLAQRA